MKVANIVKNSIWFDPRVRKQIIEYAKYNYELTGIGVKDEKYNEREINKLPGEYKFAKKINSPTLFSKMKRELISNKEITKFILEANPDVIHANDLNALIPAYKAWKKLKRKPILIYDSHEIFLENPWINRNKIIKFVWSIYEKRIIKHVDILVSVSHSALHYLQKKYSTNKGVVVTNSVRLEDILNSKKFNNTHSVLNQGQFYEGRGHLLMVEAAKESKLSNVNYEIRGYGELQEKIISKCQEYNLKNFCINEPVKTYELITAASRSTIGVAITEKISLNFIHSVSNKIFEYCAAGLPVIMSDIPEHRYLNNMFNIGVIIEDDDPTLFNAAIEHIIETPETYEQYSKNAIKMAKELCWENEFKKLISLITNLKRNINK